MIMIVTDVCVCREACLPGGTVENSRHKVSGGKLRQMQSAPVSRNSATEQVIERSVVYNDMTHLNQKAVNAKNALTRIETKTKTKTSQSVTRDSAREARTVFVGNVALSVTKKVRLVFQSGPDHP